MAYHIVELDAVLEAQRLELVLSCQHMEDGHMLTGVVIHNKKYGV